MIFAGPSRHDAAAERAEYARDVAVQRIQESLRTPGTAICVDCGTDIDRARRIEMPSATRCIFCQTKFERTKRR